MKEDKIKLVAVRFREHAEVYTAHTIKVESIHVQGDPFDHFVGRNEKGEIMWRINCLIPTIVEYETQS